MVKATDPFGAMVLANCDAITVTDVNEDPSVTGEPASIDHAENGNELQISADQRLARLQRIRPPPTLTTIA